MNGILGSSFFELASSMPEPEMDAGDYYAECMAHGRIREVDSALLKSVGYVDGDYAQGTIDLLRRELAELSIDSLRFLGGLNGKLTRKECEIFWELLAFFEADSGERIFRSYADIGKRLGGVTKQAIGARVKALDRKCPDIAEIITACRKRTQPSTFSGISPSERRKYGIDESYNYDAG